MRAGGRGAGAAVGAAGSAPAPRSGPAPGSAAARAFVMSLSRCRMSSSFFGSVTTICTPIAIFDFRRSMSSSAILAFFTVRGMPCPARPP